MGNAQCNGSGSDSDLTDDDSCPGLVDESFESSDEETTPIDPEILSQNGDSETEEEDPEPPAPHPVAGCCASRPGPRAE